MSGSFPCLSDQAVVRSLLGHVGELELVGAQERDPLAGRVLDRLAGRVDVAVLDLQVDRGLALERGRRRLDQRVVQVDHVPAGGHDGVLGRGRPVLRVVAQAVADPQVGDVAGAAVGEQRLGRPVGPVGEVVVGVDLVQGRHQPGLDLQVHVQVGRPGHGLAGQVEREQAGVGVDPHVVGPGRQAHVGADDADRPVQVGHVDQGRRAAVDVEQLRPLADEHPPPVVLVDGRPQPVGRERDAPLGVVVVDLGVGVDDLAPAPQQAAEQDVGVGEVGLDVAVRVLGRERHPAGEGGVALVVDRDPVRLAEDAGPARHLGRGPGRRPAAGGAGQHGREPTGGGSHQFHGRVLVGGTGPTPRAPWDDPPGPDVRPQPRGVGRSYQIAAIRGPHLMATAGSVKGIRNARPDLAARPGGKFPPGPRRRRRPASCPRERLEQLR